MRWQSRFSLLGKGWRNPETPDKRDLKLARFRQVLLAANQTRGYRESLREAGLVTRRAIGGLRSIDEALKKLPGLDRERFWKSPSEFSNPAAAPPQPQPFWCPLDAKLRVVIAAQGFRESESVRMFDPARAQGARVFDPEVVAAPLSLWLSWAKESHSEKAPRAQRALVVFTGLQSGPISEAARDHLWSAFQVPVFEQWLGADGSVLATECEAHDGLHIVANRCIVEQDSNRRLILTSLTDQRRPMLRLAGFHGILVTQPCDCGQSGMRVSQVSSAPEEHVSGALARSSR